MFFLRLRLNRPSMDQLCPKIFCWHKVGVRCSQSKMFLNGSLWSSFKAFLFCFFLFSCALFLIFHLFSLSGVFSVCRLLDKNILFLAFLASFEGLGAHLKFWLEFWKSREVIWWCSETACVHMWPENVYQAASVALFEPLLTILLMETYTTLLLCFFQKLITVTEHWSELNQCIYIL